MKINYTTNSIEMNKTEAKKASVIGSDEYKAVISAKREFPSYSIDIISNKQKKTSGIRGLTYEYMEELIRKEGTTEQLDSFLAYSKGEYNTKAAYGAVRKWFLDEFPQVTAFREKIRAISSPKKAV